MTAAPGPAAEPRPARLHLAGGSIHVWRVDVERIAGRQAWRALSEGEVTRARRFHSPCDRERFVARRAALRAILAAYLGRPARSLCFSSAPGGKPLLVPAPGEAALHFSLSASDRLVLCAVSADCRLGVDVERVRSDHDIEGPARLCFSRAQLATLLELPPALRHARFFRLWTSLEAALKALGVGLAGLTPGGLEAGRLAGWSRYDGLAPCPGYVGALVAEGDGHRLRYLDLGSLPPRGVAARPSQPAGERARAAQAPSAARGTAGRSDDR
jgi:4'-phosphopantetheinyl transferase